MPVFEGKLVTLKDYRRLIKKAAVVVDKESMVGLQCFWFEGGNRALREGNIIEHTGDDLKIDSMNRNKNENPEYKRTIKIKNINSIKIDKGKK